MLAKSLFQSGEKTIRLMATSPRQIHTAVRVKKAGAGTFGGAGELAPDAAGALAASRAREDDRRVFFIRDSIITLVNGHQDGTVCCKMRTSSVAFGPNPQQHGEKRSESERRPR